MVFKFQVKGFVNLIVGEAVGADPRVELMGLCVLSQMRSSEEISIGMLLASSTFGNGRGEELHLRAWRICVSVASSSHEMMFSSAEMVFVHVVVAQAWKCALDSESFLSLRCVNALNPS